MNNKNAASYADHGELFNALPVAMAVHDDQGNLLAVNEALCELLGYARAEITTMTWADLLDSQNGEPAARHELMRHQRSLVGAHGQRVFCDVHSTRSEHADESVWLTAVLDVGQRRRYIGQLHDELIYDELTGLLNRRGIWQLLSRLLAENTDGQLAVLFCDLDNFKRINDSLGHEVGDELLSVLATRLRHGLPPGCTPARHSGDEFLVVCADLAAAGGLDALTDIVSELLTTTIVPRGYEIAVSASIGAATVSDPSHTPQDLLRFADSAMYHAKNQGGARVVRADPDLTNSLEQEMQLEGQLRLAIIRDELVLHYQPIVDQAGRVIGAEALLRWPHPEHGLLSAEAILPAARRAGLLAELDRWVLRTALHEAVQWPHTEAGRPVGIAVNLGSQLLHSPKFADDLAGIVTDCGIAWDRVTLEITETDLLDLTPGTLAAMTDLVARGVRFAVDDFGTGYSSLERLKDLPVQVIKLDRKFVSGVGDDPVDTAIAGAALSIAQARGISCIAEGVENTDQLYRLAALGYDTHQGFLFSAAVPGAELRTLINCSPALNGSVQRRSPVAVRVRSERTEVPPPRSRCSPVVARRQGKVTGTTGMVPGEHLCWAYQYPEEFQTRAREYVLDGIRLGQQVLYLGNAPASHLRTQLALDDRLAAALETGALSVSSVTDSYPVDHSGAVMPEATTATFLAAAEEALAAGYSGYRVIGDGTPMVRTPAHREAFARSEYLFDHAMSAQPVTGLCAYDVTQLGSSAIAELACLHPLTSPHASPFRLYSEPPDGTGGRYLGLAGSVDLPCADLLVHALRHNRQEELLINDRGLEILDPRALLALDRHAREHEQRLILRLARPLATRLTGLFDRLTHTRIEAQAHSSHPHPSDPLAS
ncbi:EAL domain-containing protein [Saccharopolyspora phatthalungensis]|uniref:Diguanylate cyclase (GGDEF)-like protein/PAS domain S-box-containing protein n=1 Tax=Saccharopolyspora phatthalungensis TaxID=664693 RepID=A0A840QF61_9PSEU|nr:EAL domain-containing protein [Saccharopolyspora phatthalungensis]MBB5158697.1 diguanylate cyclase (GGDEF)-like protein/PAS domain S-box-containing protein [Saccharopolyspora phatthalungensis]